MFGHLKRLVPNRLGELGSLLVVAAAGYAVYRVAVFIGLRIVFAIAYVVVFGVLIGLIVRLVGLIRAPGNLERVRLSFDEYRASKRDGGAAS